MLKKITHFFLLSAVAIFLANCASLAGFQDGKTIGKDAIEIGFSANYNTTPAFNDLDDGSDSIDVDLPTIGFPNFEIGFKYGAAEKVDVTFRANSSLNVALGVKAQLVGDQDSKFALGAGAEVGSFAVGLGIWNVQIPVYASVHPSETFAVYFGPKYIYQFAGFAGTDNGWSYIGGNGGLLFGKKNKFGLDFGYYSVGVNDVRETLFQFGLGGRFKFGGNSGGSKKGRK